MNADLYNRQLHPDDQAQAKKLADLAKTQRLTNTDGSPVTATDIANQLAQMDKSAAGQTDAGGNRMAVGDKPNDGTNWQSYGVNQAGQHVWTQVLPPADSGLQAFIVHNTGSGASSPAYTPSTQLPITGVRGPDFVNFQLDLYVASVWGAFTRDGNSFAGGGLNFGMPNPAGATASVQFGWLNRSSVAPGQTNNFMSGYAGQAVGAYAGLGAGTAYSPGNGSATVIGFGVGETVGDTKNPISVGGGYSLDRGKTGLGW
ncbi:hypothetical protein [Cupriavidus basilensis]|uniref:hypothetical protein n=1 Tax=Cupriavidus basilensis TaxID=68895 RepID=UPI0011471694|nr:hypothetical protein [Cupriavidus basilensis]